MFTTLLDFADVGDIAVFIDDEQLALADKHMFRIGYLEGQHMANAFNLMRGIFLDDGKWDEIPEKKGY